MTLEKGPFVVFTRSLAMELETLTMADMIRRAVAAWRTRGAEYMAFDPECKETRFEDGGITVILSAEGLREIVYAKIDDYGPNAENRYVLTFYKQGEN